MNAHQAQVDRSVRRRQVQRLWAQCGLAAVLAGCSGGSEVQFSFEPPRTMRPLQVRAGVASNLQTIQIEGLTLAAARRVSRSVFEYDYELTLKNDGAAQDEVFVQLTGVGPGTSIVSGAVLAVAIGAGATVTPAERVTIRHDRTLPFQAAALAWTVDATVGRLAGTAAAGAAMAFGRVRVSDRSGANACAQSTISTGRDGRFACQVLQSSAPPYLLWVTSPSGWRKPMFSHASAAPGAGSSAVVNITTLTTAILRQLAPDNDLRALIADPSLVDPATLTALVGKVLAQIAAARIAVGLSGDYSPFWTPIVAASVDQPGNAADLLLDLVHVAGVSGRDHIYTLDDPDGAVPLAGPTTVSPDLLPAPSAEAMAVPEAVRQHVARLYACLQVPNRVLAVDDSIPANQGGPKVTQVVAACEGIWADDYLDNGYSWGQRWYKVLTSPRVPDGLSYELLRYFPGATSGPFSSDGRKAKRRASALTSGASGTAPLINGNVEPLYAKWAAEEDARLMREYPEMFGLAPNGSGSSWSDFGNQAPIDFTILNVAERIQQYSTLVFGDADWSKADGFRSGFQFIVNATGPGSLGLTAVVINLSPYADLNVVMAPVTGNPTTFTIFNKEGILPLPATPVSNVGRNLYPSRTESSSGGGEKKSRKNPGWDRPKGDDPQKPWVRAIDCGASPSDDGCPAQTKVAQALDYPVHIVYSTPVSATYTRRPTAKEIQDSDQLWKDFWQQPTNSTDAYFDPQSAQAGSHQQITLGFEDQFGLACPFASGTFATPGGVPPFPFLLQRDGVVDGSGNWVFDSSPYAPGFPAFPAGTDNPWFFRIAHMTCSAPPGQVKVQQFRRDGSGQ